jgi:hypothetical protein
MSGFGDVTRDGAPERAGMRLSRVSEGDARVRGYGKKERYERNEEERPQHEQQPKPESRSHDADNTKD